MVTDSLLTCLSHKNSIRYYTKVTERMAAVHALRPKIFKKANGCVLKDRRKAGGRFVYSARISHR